MRIRSRSCHCSNALLGALGLGALGAAAAAAVVYVNAERLDVVDKKRTVAKTVVTVERNTALNVLAQEGNWYKVDVGGKQGYVFANAVSNQPGSGKGKGVSLAAVKGVSDPRLDSAAAIKGVGEGAKQYASANGLNTSGLQELIRRRDAISPAEFDQFLAAGGLLESTAEAPSRGGSPALASSGK
jgi:hypothetical protein